jgi:uncharacterized protein (TIGR02284 family)
MAQKTERWVLNHLIETCRDGERGFRHAANHVQNAALKALFLEIATQRDAFATALLPHADRLGGPNAGDGSVAGALHRGWMSLKDTLGGHHDEAVLKEAEHGEHSALAAYEDALAGVLAPPTREEIERQCVQVKQSYDKVSSHAIA